MPRLNLSLPKGLTASIISNHEGVEMLTDKTRMFLGAYLPGAEISDINYADSDILIEHRQSEDNELSQRGTKVTLREQWGQEIPLDIYHLLYSAERAKLIERGVFPVHSACVEDKNGDSILLIGPSGSGKSTTALDLVTQGGMKMFSGNKTVVEFDDEFNMRPIAGTPTMTIRTSDRERFEGLIGEELEYYNRLAFKLSKEYFAETSRGQVRAIILVRLQDGPKIMDPPVHPNSAFHQLYHPFLDVDCSHATATNCEGPFITTDSRDQIERLSRKLRRSLFKVPLINMFGPLDFIRGNIQNLIANDYGQT